MAGLLIVPPLHLDAVNPTVAAPSEQVLELLARRPTAVVSTLAAAATRAEVEAIAFIEPVAGWADGGYARQCVRLLEADLACRAITFGRVRDGHSDVPRVFVRDGDVFVHPEPAVGGESVALAFPDAGTALLLHAGRRDPEPLVVDPLVSLSLRMRAPGSLDADALLDLLLEQGRQALAMHPERFVVAQAVLEVDRPVRRLLRWPGVAEQALDDLRLVTARLGLRLWWDELLVEPGDEPAPASAALDCRDALAADLLGVGGGR
ncbi:MAG: hypothetical protein IT196_19195 [Acidimicrobiales bacterium]|nr:hypothetical protein [Acidimicrobiales bacterium]